MRSAVYDLTQPEFVSANRYGQLTPQQLDAFKAAYLWPGVGFLALGILFGGFFLLMTGGMLIGMLSDGDDEWWIALIFLIFPIFLGGGFLIGGVRNLWTWFRVSTPGSLATAEGRLVWRRNNYRAEIDGANLSLPGSSELPPGAYRFFYVTGANLVASAERLSLSLTAVDQQEELSRAMRDALDFTQDDLEANKTMQLSGRQRNNMIFGVIGLAILLGVLVLVPLGIFGAVWFTEGGFSLDGSDIVPFLFFGGVMVVIDAVIFASILSGVREAFAGRVESVTGYLDERTEVRGSGKSRRTYYYYIIDNQKFTVTPAAHKASIKNLRYTLYYLPKSRKVVSAVPIPTTHYDQAFPHP